MIHKLLLSCSIFLSPLLLQAQSFNADPLFDLSLDELLNIQITSASKKEENLLTAPSAVEIITKEELEALKCNRLSECIEYVTGISNVNGEGNIFETSTIRGNTLVNYNTNTLLLVDGIPVLNSYHGSFNLDAIPLSAVDQIEIVKGASSVLYGTNAINGVINIITIKDAERGMVRARYGDNNTLLISTALSYDINEDFSLRLFAEHASSDAESFTIHDEAGESREFAQKYKNNSLIAKLEYKDVWVHASLYEHSLPNYKTRGFTKNGLDAKEENDESEYLLAMGFKHNITSDFSLKFQTAYHKWNLKKERLEGTSTWDYDSYSSYNELELHMFEESESSNILGASYEYANAHRYKSENSSYDIGQNDQNTQNISLYDNGNYLLAQNWNLLYGGRYFYSQYHDETQQKDIKNTNFSARGGVIYTPKKNLSFKLLYSQAFRVPTYFEKEVSSTTLKGNANLTPELSQTYDLIYVQELENFNYSLGLFYTQIEDKITRVDVGSGWQQNQNIGTVDFYGLEFTSKFHFTKTFWGFANYSFTKAANTDTQRATKFTYNNTLNILFSKSFSKNYLINTNIKYLSDWGEAEQYFLWNISGEYKVHRLENLSFELIVKNILGQEIDLPEIARDNSVISTIPKDYTQKFYLGMKYEF